MVGVWTNEWIIRVALHGESQLRPSRATQPTVLVGCFSISIIKRTLTWTTGSWTCAQMWMHAIAHGGCTDTVRESALKVDSGRKIPCRTGESNQRWRRAGPMLYQLSYIPTKQSFTVFTKRLRRSHGVCRCRILVCSFDVIGLILLGWINYDTTDSNCTARLKLSEFRFRPSFSYKPYRTSRVVLT